ncbi:MAG: hypothetical protein FJ303_15985 [Planctomycetes bacterium]|nr:hypothetical protein [Planctomycetota bacterium]
MRRRETTRAVGFSVNATVCADGTSEAARGGTAGGVRAVTGMSAFVSAVAVLGVDPTMLSNNPPPSLCRLICQSSNRADEFTMMLKSNNTKPNSTSADS